MTEAPSRKPALRAEATVSADDAGVSAAAAFATRFAAERGLDTAVQLRLALVMEELLTNLANYGYPAGAPRGSAILRLGFENDRLTLEMIDDGEPFDPLAAPPPDLVSAPERRPVGGLGLHLVRSLAETADYARIDDRNHLTLTLRR